MSFTSEHPATHPNPTAAYRTHNTPDPADADILARAARLLDEQGHPQAAAVLRAAQSLTWPNRAAGFGGRWQIHIDPTAQPPRLFDVTQQIKRALNSICGLNASYADLCVGAQAS